MNADRYSLDVIEPQDDPLYTQESVFGWIGWSLSAAAFVLLALVIVLPLIYGIRY